MRFGGDSKDWGGQMNGGVALELGKRVKNSPKLQSIMALAGRLQAEGLTGVTVKVIGDGAYLDGTVKTKLDRDRAATLAVMAAPVKVRTNLIRVEPGFFGF